MESCQQVTETVEVKADSSQWIAPAVFAGQDATGNQATRLHNTPNLIRRIMDSVFKKITVYPNPASRNSELKIDMEKLEPGSYTVSIIDMAGVVVQTDDVRLEQGGLVRLTLLPTAGGTYFVHVFNRRTAASYIEKLVVQ